jgi:hypothetical protein
MAARGLQDLTHQDLTHQDLTDQGLTNVKTPNGRETMPTGIRSLMALSLLAAAMTATAANAQKKYDPGASDTEIKIGNIMPYSGPASS